MGTTRFCGASLVVSPNGVTGHASGVADPSTGRVWTVGTQSQVASISKQFVAACALILVGRGVLRLDDPIGRHLGDAGAAGEISVAGLLTHTSGVPHWSDEPGYIPTESMPASDRLRLLLDGWRAGAHEPEFLYSSPGYVVASAVLAAAAKRPYPELVRELVLDPLGLTETTLASPWTGPVAVGGRHGQPVPTWDFGDLPGTGDVWSTVGDVARFLSALHTGALLPDTVQPLLHRLRVPRPDGGSTRIRLDGYALGHFVGSVHATPARVHPGDNPGFQSLAVHLPASSTTVVVLTNDEAVDIESEVTDLVERGVS